MSRLLLLVGLLALLASHAAARSLKARKPQDAQATPDAHVPSAVSVEIHHSLRKPLDQSQVYWNFGGSTVLTKKWIRLTPAAQNRRGWLWNDYPIESPNWEVEFEVEVWSKPHFGGDGFCFWMLDGSQDPTFHQSDPEYLNGNVFGMKDSYRGFGVCFDVYDNDGRRDNPSIFVLYNPEGKEVKYNHDNDYADDMYKNISPGTNAAYTCVANVRNTENPTRVMIKYLHNILHVYVDTNDGLGYKFCLADQFEKPFKDHHIAFSAMTGQVADAIDILSVSTKYLEESDSVDDALLTPLHDGPKCHSVKWFFWFMVTIAGIGLAVVCAKELHQYKAMDKAQINPVQICNTLNATMEMHAYVHLGVCALLLLGAIWVGVLPFVVNVPLLGFRLYQLSKNQIKLSPVQLGGEKVHAAAVSLVTRLGLMEASYILSLFLYLQRWWTC